MLLAFLVTALVSFAAFAAPALAAQTHAFTGTSFGPDGVGGSEEFESLSAVAVDAGNGDVFAYDNAGTGTIYKFDSNGTPLDFSALGSNAITGVGGGPAGAEFEIAIAPAGAPAGTAGDLYVANNSSALQVYGPDGSKLGEVVQGRETCGTATDPSGNFYTGIYSDTIHRYTPTANPPTTANEAIGLAIGGSICNVAADGLGNIYAAAFDGSAGLRKLEGISDASPKVIDPSASTMAVAPGSNDLYADRGTEIVQYDTAGAPIGRFGEGELSESRGIAVNSDATKIYVDVPTEIRVFGPAVTVPDPVTEPATGITNQSVTLNGTISADGGSPATCEFQIVTQASFESEGFTGAQIAPCDPAGPFTGSSAAAVSAGVTGLQVTTSYRFRLRASNSDAEANGIVLGFETDTSVRTEPASPVGVADATLNGAVFPEKLQYTDCQFEYGSTSTLGFESTSPCEPEAADIPPNAGPDAVSLAITGLQPNTTYRFRISATKPGGTAKGRTLTFTTSGQPLITETRASFADQTAATLEARIDPRSSDTAYRIEWGPTVNYDRIGGTGQILEGEGSTRVSTRLQGLSSGQTYHYRIVAENGAGTTTGPDHEFNTLNDCGLVEGRCFELVSPSDAGPVALPGEVGESELTYQAGNGQGEIAYGIETGLPDSTTGANVLYRGVRGPSGWASSQISAPITAQNETKSTGSGSALTYGLSPDLRCGFLESSQPLTEDPGPRLLFEAGGINLYRLNPDRSYTAVTSLPPTNPEESGTYVGGGYPAYGFSQNCSKLVFASDLRYPGVPYANSTAAELYEWDEGDLRSIGLVPGPGGGEVPVKAEPGAAYGLFANQINAVSADGSRIFFSANRQTSSNSEEVGKKGLFVREDGVRTLDLSMSETSTADESAVYQWATPDASRVFFTANAGLTAESSEEGTDLYEYDLRKAASDHPLKDLSISQQQGGAQVGGFLGSSEDGSHVYFAAQGELVSGKGRSLTENRAAKTYSIYSEHGGVTSYVGSAREFDLGAGLTVARANLLSSRVSPDGRYLLFQTAANVTGYEGGGTTEAYLFDSENPTEPTVCISCRQDGRPPATLNGNLPLQLGGPHHYLYRAQLLAVRNGKPIVYFSSFDRLAKGGIEGLDNIYQWSAGQISEITTEPSGLSAPPYEKLLPEELYKNAEQNVRFAGASPEGTDLYFATTKQLTWEDRDGRYSVYDARVGGGFLEPPAGPSVCDADAEGSCQNPGAPATPQGAPDSASFAGPGNPKSKHHKRKHHKTKRHKARHHKAKSGKKQHGKSRQGKPNRGRHGNGSGGAGR